MPGEEIRPGGPWLGHRCWRPWMQRSAQPHRDDRTPGPGSLGFVKKCGNGMDNLAGHHQATVRLLLAFLAFGAACSTLWAWMLAQSGGAGASPRQ